MDRAEALEQIREKEGENAGPDHVFVGYHCQDCIYWEMVNGKGRCQLTGEAHWPGDPICDNFAQ